MSTSNPTEGISKPKPVEEPQPKNGTNGESLKDFPMWFRQLFFVFQRAGLAATIVLVAIIGIDIYFWQVSIPDAKAFQQAQNELAAAQTEFLKQSTKRQQQMADLMDRIVASEQQQAEWQINWKHEIEEQHAKRAQEARELQARCDEQSKVHAQQIKLMEEMVNKLNDKPKAGG